MKGIVEERAVELAEYIVENKTTVRAAAKQFGVSKSTVHMDVARRLRSLNPQLYSEVREILESHDKIYTQIKIDEITNLGAVRIRLRSLFAAIEQQQALAASRKE